MKVINIISTKGIAANVLKSSQTVSTATLSTTALSATLGHMSKKDSAIDVGSSMLGVPCARRKATVRGVCQMHFILKTINACLAARLLVIAKHAPIAATAFPVTVTFIIPNRQENVLYVMYLWKAV